ncbi:MAG: dihydrodipicolinate synthase family protein [Cellvibrionaceae bacterium]
MNSTKALKGIIPVLLSPLNKDGSVDHKGTSNLVDFLIKAGSGGFWAMGSASEDINLTKETRLESLRVVSEVNARRVPIIAGAGLTSIDDIYNFFDDVADLAIDGIHILPYDIKMGETRLVHFLNLLADKSPVPIWMYHNPKRGRAISANVIKEVHQHENIAGIKVGGYNLTEMLSAVMFKSDGFDVIGAGSGQLYSMLSLGAEAHTTSDASVFPEPFVDVYNTFKEGRLEEAREKQFKLINLSKSLPRTDNGEYAAEEKYMLSLRGVCEEYVNPLYRTLSNEEKDKLRRALQGYGFSWA